MLRARKAVPVRLFARKKISKGFTLLELLIALSLLSFLIAGLYVSVGTSATHAIRLGVRIEDQQALRIALQRIMTDLSGAYVVSDRPHLYFTGIRQDGEGGGLDSLELTAVVFHWDRFGGKIDDLVAIRYFVDTGPAGGGLFREEKPVSGGNPAAYREPVLILPGVKNLRFTYLDGAGGDHETWSTLPSAGEGGLPAALRIRLGLGGDGGDGWGGDEISTIIPIPAGIRPAGEPEPDQGTNGQEGTSGQEKG